MMRECFRFAAVMGTIRTTLEEADRALRGLIAPSPSSAALLAALALDRVPEPWLALWGPTAKPLAAFMLMLQGAAEQLNAWALELTTPKIVGLHQCTMPTALFSAVLLEAAERTTAALDALEITVEVTKKQPEMVDVPPREGVYVYGLSLLCAVWDSQNNCLTDAHAQAKGPFPLPVLLLKTTVARTTTTAAGGGALGAGAAAAGGQGGTLSSASSAASLPPSTTQYVCPVYRTASRAAGTYVYALKLRSRVPSSYWTLRGVALVADS
jgi:hypothetical protein